MMKIQFSVSIFFLFCLSEWVIYCWSFFKNTQKESQFKFRPINHRQGIVSFRLLCIQKCEFFFLVVCISNFNFPKYAVSFNYVHVFYQIISIGLLLVHIELVKCSIWFSSRKCLELGFINFKYYYWQQIILLESICCWNDDRLWGYVCM